jgi:hypothetical protein
MMKIRDDEINERCMIVAISKGLKRILLNDMVEYVRQTTVAQGGVAEWSEEVL